MDLRLNAADAAVQADYKKTIYENPLQFSYTGNFNYEAIPLTKRVIGMWKVLPLAVMTVAQLAKAILYSPLALASTKVDIAQGEMYKVAYLARRTFAHTIAPFYNCDQKAQRLDFAARYSATCETIRREKYEQKTVTAKEYLDAPEELQAHWEARFGITDGFYAAITETDESFLDGINLSWNPLEAIATIARREGKAMVTAIMTERVTRAMASTATPTRTVVRNLTAQFEVSPSSATATPSADKSTMSDFGKYFVRNPDSNPPSAKKEKKKGLFANLFN